MKTYEEIMTNKYHVNNENAVTDLFKAIPLSNLNNWLKQLSLNDELSLAKERIKILKDKIEEKHQAYLDSIKTEENLIKKLEEEVVRLQKSNVRDLNKRAEKIHKIIEEAINQNPDLAANQAKDLLIGKTPDPIVNINSLTTLSEEEKEELYQIYIDEFKKLAGLKE